MRDRAGNAFWAGGSRRNVDGRTEVFSPQSVRFEPTRRWTSPRTALTYPVELRVSAGGVDYQLTPLLDDQELDSGPTTGTIYWEGAVRVTRDGRPIGRGYLELTGYGGTLRI
jgi:predicted secreted hydrolase